jgi:predicted SAM-dependent methyltransferase
VAARTCHQFLKVGGYLRVAVPDGLNPNPDYRDRVRIGGSGAGADDHRVLYDHRTLGALLTGAGFTVDLLEYFDADGNFHAKAWDPAAGLIRRSRAFDTRNADGKLRYTSLIIDAFKAPAPSR